MPSAVSSAGLLFRGKVYLVISHFPASYEFTTLFRNAAQGVCEDEQRVQGSPFPPPTPATGKKQPREKLPGESDLHSLLLLPEVSPALASELEFL